MKLTCPSCGAIHSAESWQNDAEARKCLAGVAGLPGGIGKSALSYLALFRPASGRGLSWSRAGKLLTELSAMIASGFIQWEGKAARPAGADVWMQALCQILENPPKRLPLKSHGYLKAIAYDIADATDRSNERSKREVENAGSFRSRNGAKSEPERIDKEVLREIREKNFKAKRLKANGER